MLPTTSRAQRGGCTIPGPSLRRRSAPQKGGQAAQALGRSRGSKVHSVDAGAATLVFSVDWGSTGRALDCPLEHLQLVFRYATFRYGCHDLS